MSFYFLTKQPLTNEVTVVDVGQGDSVLLRDAKGKTVLIDVGGRVDFGADEAWKARQTEPNASRTLIPYLHSRGISQIDQLVLTHTDTDHVGDLEVVAQQVRIGEILVSPGSLTDEEFVQRLKALQVPVRAIRAGEQLPIMGSQLHVLYPFGPGDGGNNDSIVLYGQLLNKNFLFTGDLEEAGEETLKATYPDLPVDILKAGHHGSKGSSSEAFLDHIQPELADKKSVNLAQKLSDEAVVYVASQGENVSVVQPATSSSAAGDTGSENTEKSISIPQRSLI